MLQADEQGRTVASLKAEAKQQPEGDAAQKVCCLWLYHNCAEVSLHIMPILSQLVLCKGTSFSGRGLRLGDFHTEEALLT